MATWATQTQMVIGRNLAKAARQHPGRHDSVVVSRSGSTRRGHFPAELSRVVAVANTALHSGRDVVILTSRQWFAGTDAEASLAIGKQVSDALVEVLRRIQVQPRYRIAKSGVTSSDLATRGLGVRCPCYQQPEQGNP